MKFRNPQAKTKIRVGKIYNVDVKSFDGFIYKGKVKVLQLGVYDFGKDKAYTHIPENQKCKWHFVQTLDDRVSKVNIAETFFKK